MLISQSPAQFPLPRHEIMFNPYESPQATLFGTSSNFRGKQWDVVIGGRSRRITLSHSRYGMATTVWVDGERVYRSGNIFSVVENAELQIEVDGHEVLLVIRSRLWGSEYSILLDGRLIDGAYGEESDRRRARTRAYFEAVICLIIGVLLAAVEIQPITKLDTSSFPFAGSLLMAFGLGRLVYLWARQ